jgi:AmmeMemoRadiSam system protein A
MARSPSPDRSARLPVVDATGRRHLLDVAREAVRVGLAERRQYLPDTSDLPRPLGDLAATFVTLRRREELLGCIGTMEPMRSMADDVARNAASAAFADPRLPAVTWADFDEMSVKISILGPLVPLDVHEFGDLKLTIRRGVHGLLVEDGPRRGTFLPSVWEQVPDHEQFLGMLWEKAGLAPGTWPRSLKVFRYETLEFGD